MKLTRKRPAPFKPAFIESLEGRTLFAFGVTNGTAPTGQSTYVIDNGTNLKFSVLNGRSGSAVSSTSRKPSA